MTERAKPHRRRRAGITWGAELEHDVPGARYGVVLVLLLVTFVFMAAGPTGRWVPLVTVVLQGVTVLAALAAAESQPLLVRISAIAIGLGVVGGIAALVTDEQFPVSGTSVMAVLLVGIAPVAIALSIVRRRNVDVQTVLGSICIYVLLGMTFAFLFDAMDELTDTAFFAQQSTATLADFLYFSFVTLATVGYGDLTAATDLGRAVAVLEALLGQIYLVTVVALLVSRIGDRRGT